ncbi:unnamed protein product [Caenorhabditis angaria]|uniref:CUB domain-containing protein n=1 Tax=Caenorhabditis angaria TaxID=860376 RepID=A0A9P1I634_9PELO|nr:unnamed protein product [Caenorhabditis angaria]
MYILLVLLFFSQSISQASSTCDQNITDISHLNFNLTILPNCTKHLPIYPGKSIELEIFCGAGFDIYLIVNVDGDYHTIYHSYFSSNCERTKKSSIIWRAPKNTGLILENKIDSQGDDGDYEDDFYHANSTIQVSVIKNSNVCGYPLVKLNTYYQETIIQTDTTFDNSQACIYRLIAPQNFSFNKIMISFNTTDHIKYDKRVYRNPGSPIFHEESFEVNNQSFVLETFDILLREYVNPPEVYANLFYDRCLRGIETIKIQSNEELRTIVISEDFLDYCDFTRTSIFRIEIIDKKPDEYIIFDHDIEVQNDRHFNLYHLNDREHQIMNSTHWLKTAAFNTTGLYLEIMDKHALYTVTVNIYRVKIKVGCPYSFYDSDTFREDGKTSLEIAENCKTVVYHWRIINQHLNAKIIDLSLGIEGAHRNDTIDVNEHNERFSRNANIFIKSGLPYDTSSRKLEVAFVRLQSSHKQATKINFAWKFAINCKCISHVRYLALGSSENITSLNYPEPYCKNLQCRAHFYTDEEAIFEIHLNFFQLDKNGDHLSIYNGGVNNLNLIEYLDGKHSLELIKAGQQITFLFESNSRKTRNDKGFHITLKSVKKPKDLLTTTSHSVEVTTSESKKYSGSTSYGVVISIFILLILVVGGIGFFEKHGKLNLIIEKIRR